MKQRFQVPQKEEGEEKNDAAIEIQLPFENMKKNVHVHENIGDPIAWEYSRSGVFLSYT